MAALASWRATTSLPSDVLSSRCSTMRMNSFCSASSGSAMALSRPAPRSITSSVLLISGRASGGQPLEMLLRPTTVVGGGSAIILNMRMVSTDSSVTSWLQFRASTSGSRKTSVMGTPAASAAGSSASMAMLARPSVVVGMPCTPIVRAMTRAPYFAASCITLSRRAGSAEAELSMAWRAHFWSQASIAARLVVSSESGTSVTACTASTIQGITSRPSFFCGPMLRSRTPAPASTCARAMAWMTLASRASTAAFTGGAMMWMFSPIMSTGDLLALGLGQHGLDDGRHGHGQVTVVGELEDGPAGGVQGRDQRIVGQHGQEVQAVFVDGLANLRREAIGRPVDDEVVLADLGVELRQKGGDAPRRGNATHRGVADDEQQVDVAGGAARQVLEAGLVVDDHPRVAVGDGVDDGAQHVVGGAVATGALGPAHGQQVDADALDDAGVDLVVEQILLGDAGLELVAARLVGGVFADIADGALERQAKDVVEVAGRIGVDGQHGALVTRGEAAHQQAGDRRLAGAALAGDRDRGRHGAPPRLAAPTPPTPVCLPFLPMEASRAFTVGKESRSVCGMKRAEVYSSMKVLSAESSR